MQVNMTKYALEVSRFGFMPRFKHEGGRGYNVSHDLSFSWQDLRSDGEGNVLVSPPLKRKPCFGRPEAFFRTYFGARTERIDTNCINQIEKNRCDVCPIFHACKALCDERIGSDPSVEEAFDAWIQGTGHLPKNGKFRSSSTLHLWSKVLHAIRSHGGWTNVNDLQVILHDQKQHEERNKKRRDSARAARRAKMLVRQGKRKAVTPAFLAAVAAERNRRLRVLHQIASLAGAHRWISKLTPDGMRRTADVWEAQTLFAREGLPVTGRAVAEWLVQYDKVRPANLSSLTTAVHRDFDRIAKLERVVGGAAVWTSFTP